MEVKRIGKRGLLFIFDFGDDTTNIYTIKGQKHWFVIDTFLGPGAIIEIETYLKGALDEKPVIVVNTHAHFDHIMANGPLVEATGAPLALHPLDLPLLQQGGGAGFFGLEVSSGPEPDMELAEGDTIVFGQQRHHLAGFINVITRKGIDPYCPWIRLVAVYLTRQHLFGAANTVAGVVVAPHGQMKFIIGGGRNALDAIGGDGP